MSIDELPIPDEERLEILRLYDRKQQLGVAPIDVEASNYADSMRFKLDSGEIEDSEKVRKAIEFLTRIVGWSSKDLDDETGYIRLAVFHPEDNDKDEFIDENARFFLESSEHVTIYTSEHDSVESKTVSYEYIQSRKNGKIILATVSRTETVQSNPPEVEYYLKYEVLGEHPEDHDRVLQDARILLENSVETIKKFTMAPAHISFSLGRHALRAVLPKSNTL